MWVSVWVSVCVWSICFVAHRAKTYLYTETPPLQKPSPMTFVSILSPPHIIFSSLVFYHVSYSFLIAIIPGQVSPCWGMLPSPRQNALLSGLPSVEVSWKEETDQGHCWQKGVILFSQPLRTFGHTKELGCRLFRMYSNVNFCWVTFFTKSTCREPSLRMAEVDLQAAVGMEKNKGRTDGWMHGLVDREWSHFLAQMGRKRGEVKVMGVLHIVLPTVGMVMLCNGTCTLAANTQSHRARGCGLRGKSDGPLAC